LIDNSPYARPIGSYFSNAQISKGTFPEGAQFNFVSDFISFNEVLLFDDLLRIETIKETELGLKIFPNPTSDKIYCEFKNLPKNEIRLRVLNLNGQVVLNKSFSSIPSSTFPIPTETLPNGQYLLQIMDDTRVSTSKFMVQK